MQITTSTFQARQGIRIKATSTNTSLLYIGLSTVTRGVSAATTDGYELAAGDEVEIPIQQISLLYAIADAAGQSLSFVAV